MATPPGACRPAGPAGGTRIVAMQLPRAGIRPALGLALGLALAGAGAAGCGGGRAPAATPSAEPPPLPPTPAARAELAARAAAAQDLVGVAAYTLATPGRPERTILVVRATDGSWRVDIPGGALGGAADVSLVSTPAGRFHCALAIAPEAGRCVPVDELRPEVDPRVQHVFTDWLGVLTDRSAAVAVAAAPAPPGIGGRCFAVQPSAASLVAPLDAGVYCFDQDGTLTGAQLELGELTLAGSPGAAPPTIDLPAPVAGGQPLPTAAPTPPPTPTPTAPATASATG